MKRPPAGLCLPVVVQRVRDADTIEVRLPSSSYVWAIRLIDCWAPELKTAEGKAAKRFVEGLLAGVRDVHVWIPAPQHAEMLLKNITFDRLLGHLFIDGERTLSQVVCEAGHATPTKRPTA